MSGNIFSSKRVVTFILIGLFSSISFLFGSGCSNDIKTAEVEERDGLLFIHDQNKLFTGKIVDTVAKKIIEYEVVDGKKNGEFKISAINGSLEMVGEIKNNLNEGLWRYYYPNGQLESAGNFENNLSEGKWTWYFESGKIREIGYYKSGKKHSNWTIFDEKGNIKRKIFFKDGQIIDDQEFNKDMFS